MRELDICLSLAKKLKEVEEKIDNLTGCNTAPKIPTLSDMPKGSGSTSNPQENYILRLERLESRKAELIERLNGKWLLAVAKLKGAGKDESTIKMLEYRFKQGREWKDCAKQMKADYPTEIWNENKCFRLYRDIKIMT